MCNSHLTHSSTSGSMGIMEVRMVLLFLVIGFVISSSSCQADDPSPKPWPEQFHSQLFQDYTGDLAVVDLWYDWPNGRNLNIIQHQLSYKMHSLEWNNGTSFYYDLDARTCTPYSFPVGILRPDWLDNSHYLGVEKMDGFACNVWEKADFIIYYEDVETKMPVAWLFLTTGRFMHVITFEEGATLPDEVWQTPALCFSDDTINDDAQELTGGSSLLLRSDVHDSDTLCSKPWERWLLGVLQ